MEMLFAQLNVERMSGVTDSLTGDVEYHQAAAVGDVLFNWFD